MQLFDWYLGLGLFSICLKCPKSASKHRGITSILDGEMFVEVAGGVPEYFHLEKFFDK